MALWGTTEVLIDILSTLTMQIGNYDASYNRHRGEDKPG